MVERLIKILTNELYFEGEGKKVGDRLVKYLCLCTLVNCTDHFIIQFYTMEYL